MASFPATLDEALEASLLLQGVGASDPDFMDQIRLAHELLEVGATEAPRRLVMNEIDPEALASLQACMRL